MQNLGDFPGLGVFDSLYGADDFIHTEATARNFISSGDMNTFNACQMKTYFSRVQNEGFLCDLGFHYSMMAKRAVVAVMQHKMKETRPPASAEEVWDLPYNKRTLGECWKDLDSSGIWAEYPEQEDLDAKKKQLDTLLSQFITDYAWEVNPVLVEKKIFLPIPGGEKYRLHMHEFIDMVDDKGNVYLFKFLGKSPSEDKKTGEYVLNANYAQNVLAYAALLRNFKVPAEGASTNVLHFVGKKNPEIIPVHYTVTDRQVRTFADSCVKMWEIIVKDLAIANPASMYCKKGVGGCSFWEICQARIQEQEVNND